MANNFYITAGLPVAKNSGQSPTAGDNTVYITAGLAPEILSAASSLEVSVTDSLTLTDTATAILPTYEIAVTDDVTLTDTVTAEIPTYEIAVTDSLTLTDTVTAILPTYEIAVSDAVTLSDTISCELPVLEVVVSDAATLSDEAIVNLGGYVEVAVTDTATLSDEAIVNLGGYVEVATEDDITIADEVFVEVPVSEALEQLHYRWRLDDGDEDEAFWVESEGDKVITAKSKTRRLRVLVNSSGNVSSGNYRLQYRKVGDSVCLN